MRYVQRVAVGVGVALALFAPSAAVGYDATHREVPASAALGDTIAGSGVGRGAAGGPAADGRSGWKSGGSGASGQPVDVQIGTALGSQAAALLAGDADGFVAAADRADGALRADLGRRFNALRALRVSVWQEDASGAPAATPDGGWSVPVRVHYCFVVPDCTPLSVTVATTWRPVNGRPVLAAFGTTPGSDLGPRPWEVSDLRTAVGQRVLLATTPRYAARLPAMLAAAERAAAVTDRYAKWGGPPGRYVVFLAGPDEWAKWYGVKQANWVAGYAMPLTDQSTEVVLNAGRVDVAQTTEVLRHEFTHVVTLAGVHQSYEHSWWLVEGIAEYVRVVGGRIPFGGLVEVRKFVHSGRWTGGVALDDPAAGTADPDVSARYGVAFLAVRRIAERYGEPKMLDFFAAVVRDGTPVEQAAPAALGAAWDTVASDCAEYVRRTAG